MESAHSAGAIRLGSNPNLVILLFFSYRTTIPPNKSHHKALRPNLVNFFHQICYLRDKATCSCVGFLKNPSLVSISPCLSSTEYLLAQVAAISLSSFWATFLPIQARGPWL
ncbi:hypothetical protein G6O67_004523 [Ophiocordyceps sinensis]|uniref:Uncharacterized protein n=1 Tax=Ophiocordyceps sinensis TaxID=72228 RepID=A0A8H4V4P7_9HYPO|nr:hypothetical protein G6O67_004523 [Ophiocordyceps sinensis]